MTYAGGVSARWSARLSGSWPACRAGLIALAIGVGLLDGCPLPPASQLPPWQRPVVEAVRPAQRAALAPFAWIGRDLKILQRWVLFQGASGKRYRLEVDGRAGAGPWRLLYRAGDDSAYDERFGFRRVRGAWSPNNGVPGQYDELATWMADELFAGDPTLTEVRLRMQRIELAGGAVTETGKYAYELTRRRRTP